MDERPRAGEDGPERTCAVTGRKGPPETMIRFCLSPEGVVVPDLRRKLPGRGVWVSARRAAVAEAVRRQVFSRGFKAKASPPADLVSLVERLIEEDALQSLSIANKAGLAVAGTAKIEAAIRAGRLAALIHARDASPDGVAKLERFARANLREEGLAPRINLFLSRQLDLALGRTNVIHAALGEGEASAAFLLRARRLSAYLAADSEIPPGAAKNQGGEAAIG
ncbi:MAG TPA: RNA-binding protein [Roseiarcus sp.]|nr:RNA-binding protein [Roseiarcus sp.]